MRIHILTTRVRASDKKIGGGLTIEGLKTNRLEILDGQCHRAKVHQVTLIEKRHFIKQLRDVFTSLVNAGDGRAVGDVGLDA